MVIQTLKDLIKINSVNPAYEDGQPEAAMAEAVASFFQSRGIETYQQKVLPGRHNLIAELPGKNSERVLVFEAHMDTAPVVGMTIEPFKPEIRDGRLYGRGACDVKGGLAAMMHALADLKSENIVPPCTLLLAATVDEEVSFRGALKLCEGLEADAAVVAEPTDLHCVTAHKGCLRIRFHCHGKKAHSSKPHLGVNAITHMQKLIAAIEADTEKLSSPSHPLLGPATCNIGMIGGGSQVNAVPERCWMEIDRRVLPHEDVDDLKEQYQNLLDRLNDSGGPARFDMEESIRDWPLETDAGSGIVTCCKKVLEKEGIDSESCGVPFGSDASKFEKVGIPAIVLGPGNIDQAHTLNEYVECDQVEKAVEIYRQIMLSYADD